MNKIGFIGMGNMAQALCKGFVQSGLINKEDILSRDLSTLIKSTKKTFLLLHLTSKSYRLMHQRLALQQLHL